MSSEVAKLREQIEAEADALRVLSTGFKTTASHQIITAAYDRLGAHQEKLSELVGDGEAMRIIVSALGGPSFPDAFPSTPSHLPIELLPQEQRGAVRKILEIHGSKLEEDEVFFPDGTLFTPASPQTNERRYSIILPDGFRVWLKITEEGRNLLSLNPADFVCPICGRGLD